MTTTGNDHRTICKQCHAELEHCTEFRRNLIENQKTFEDNLFTKAASNDLKPDSTQQATKEDPFRNFVDVKTEQPENQIQLCAEELCDLKFPKILEIKFRQFQIRVSTLLSAFHPKQS